MTLETAAATSSKPVERWLDKPVVPWWPALTIEKLLIVLLIGAVILTRFYDLGARTMSHDEVNHVVPSYSIETYVYDPVTHGPFQFHALALSYFLFGDSDFSARVPAALFGVAVVIFTIFAWRRYLGRVGALISAFLFVISPYILFSVTSQRNLYSLGDWYFCRLSCAIWKAGEQVVLLWITLSRKCTTNKAPPTFSAPKRLIFLRCIYHRSAAATLGDANTPANFLI